MTSLKSAHEVTKKQANSGNEPTARQRTELAMERERVRRERRWAAFEEWLLANGYFSAYQSRFRARNAYIALEEWLAQQEVLRERGLAVEPLYTHYSSFFAQYKP